MKKEQSIRKAFGFLTKHASSGDTFTEAELAKASGWTKTNTSTNLSKRLSDVVEKTKGGLRAKPEILRVRYEDFQNLFRQKQRLFTNYLFVTTPEVLIYEFFMPLAREDRLREALDNLFFLDTVRQRFLEIGANSIRKELHIELNVSDQDVLNLVVEYVEEVISGYSMYLVNGRFRTSELATRAAVASRAPSAGPYLTDETTAVVRFILPVVVEPESAQMTLFPTAKMASEPSARAEQIRWLFLNIFAEAVTRVVRNEDEIWLVESGMRSALYRWVRKADFLTIREIPCALTSRWIGPGMLGEFGVIVVCSGRVGGKAERDPGRSARGR